jgi:hypothetical protein
MLMVDIDAVVVEARLLTGELGCPSCGGVLRPWGHARWRFSRREEGTVRHRPRRASCMGCAEDPCAQGSGHGVIFRVWSGAGFDLVAQDEVGAGVAGLGGGEVLAQLRDSGGGPAEAAQFA